MLKQAGTPDPGILSKIGGPSLDSAILEPLAVAVQHLEMGLVQMAQSQQAMGAALDVSRLTVYLLLNMIVEKEIFSKEEWTERYAVDVVQKMEKIQKEMQEKLKQQIAAQKAAEEGEELSSDPPVDMSEDCECDKDCGECKSYQGSDVVLPSERTQHKTVFTSDKDED